MSGTRFRLYAQPGFPEPEVVAVSGAPGSIGPGPSDRRMAAILPLDKEAPYDPPLYMPPYRGPVLPPAMPDRAGHFDHIPADAPQFLPAHLYGCVRRTLDVWEGYLGHEVAWWSAASHPRLELVAAVDWDNAHSGPGFIETGTRLNRFGQRRPFCLNFDVIAHETGHAVLFSEVGVPPPEALGEQFLAFHESFSDLMALVAALHFPSVAERLLSQTGGNLYVLNLVSRIGELSELDEIRIADNTVTMADVAGLRLGADGAWFDPLGQDRNAHSLARPLTGAVFDLLLELFQDGLVARGAVSPLLDPRGWSRAEVEAALGSVQLASERALARFRPLFFAALAEARDMLGACMAHAMKTVRPEDLRFEEVAAALVEAALAQGTSNRPWELVEIFLLRGIDPRPTLAARRPPPPAPPWRAHWRRLPYAERARRVAAAERARHGGAGGCGCDPRAGTDAYLHARGLIRHPDRAGPRAPG